MPQDLYNDFGDEERQVLGCLGDPMTAEQIVAYHTRHTPHLHGRLTVSRVSQLLAQHEADGFAVNIGEVESGEQLVQAIADHPEAVTLPEDHAATYALRQAERPDRFPGNEYWAMTQLGKDKLTAPAPNEPPPLEGAELTRALEHNVQIAQEALELEQQGERRSPEQIQAAQEVLDRQQAALDKGEA